MSMSRKHFIDLADALKRTKPDEPVSDPATCQFVPWSVVEKEKREIWEATCKAIADVSAKYNTAFDRRRFMAACRGEK